MFNKITAMSSDSQEAQVPTWKLSSLVTHFLLARNTTAGMAMRMNNPQTTPAALKGVIERVCFSEQKKGNDQTMAFSWP